MQAFYNIVHLYTTRLQPLPLSCTVAICTERILPVSPTMVRSSYVSAYAYDYVAGVLTCYAYVMLMASENQP